MCVRSDASLLTISINIHLHLPTAAFILNNYHQALKIIEDNSAILDQELQRLGLERSDVESWVQEELQYLNNKVSGELAQQALECSYVEELKKFSAAE